MEVEGERYPGNDEGENGADEERMHIVLLFLIRTNGYMCWEVHVILSFHYFMSLSPIYNAGLGKIGIAPSGLFAFH